MDPRRLAVVIGILSLAGTPPCLGAEPPGPAMRVTLAVTTTLPAGAVFVSTPDGSSERYLGGTAFVGHSPADAVTLSFAAPPGEGEIRVDLIGYGARPRHFMGRIRTSFLPGTAPRLEASETGAGALRLQPAGRERATSGAAAAPTPVPSPGGPVPVVFTLTTAMPAGAVFVEWSGAAGAQLLAGRAFVGHLPAEPIELRFAAPAGSGAFTVFLMNADGKMGVSASSAPATLVARAVRNLTATARMRVASRLEVALEPER